MLRVFEAARAEDGDDAADRLYSEWGRRYLALKHQRTRQLLADCVAAAGLEARLLEAADDESWDVPIREAMEVVCAFGGPKAQTPSADRRHRRRQSSCDPIHRTGSNDP